MNVNTPKSLFHSSISDLPLITNYIIKANADYSYLIENTFFDMVKFAFRSIRSLHFHDTFILALFSREVTQHRFSVSNIRITGCSVTRKMLMNECSRDKEWQSNVENGSTVADIEVGTQRNDEVDDDLKELESVIFKEFEEKIIYLDQEEYKQSENDNAVALFLSNITNIPSKQLLDDCQLLLEIIRNCAASSRIIRSTIRSHALTMEGLLDLMLNDDLNFTELICTHFDMIDMQWVERQARSTENVKWDSIAFRVKNKKTTPLFVELSGVKKAKGIEIPNQFYIRYHDLNIYFDSLTYYEDYYIKRTYIVLTCPLTPTKLKHFAEEIPRIFQYSRGIFDQFTVMVVRFVT
ncbi:uncharacterized protein BX663DRAFT_482557 [Cokeromyces recurvatus]|uniref:uncharacterized protein n=1 Tax=Cokeromyces recurvatus TaxID=90255 RepID=UPI00221FB53C|nr:uncharacterized protein BX663DRAFT_482557 [Cokeromyces recurvatus]KAI7906851.1 hypothetical protein BX663DRAFT_482557 [Cokeromyces recurvatus]